MKQMSASNQKWLKGIHLVVAGLWLSCVILLLALPLVARNITGGDELYMYNHIYHFVDMYVLTPAAVATLLTGLVFSLFTRWGFFRHGWLVYKWSATLAIILTGTFYLGPMVTKMLEISETKRAAALTDQYYMQGATIGLWAASINSLLLVVAVFVSVYKPWKNIRR
jgi:hypothetical protein